MFLLLLPCWLREKRLRKFNSKDFTSDEKKIEKQIQLFTIQRLTKRVQPKWIANERLGVLTHDSGEGKVGVYEITTVGSYKIEVHLQSKKIPSIQIIPTKKLLSFLIILKFLYQPQHLTSKVMIISVIKNLQKKILGENETALKKKTNTRFNEDLKRQF